MVEFNSATMIIIIYATNKYIFYLKYRYYSEDKIFLYNKRIFIIERVELELIERIWMFTSILSGIIRLWYDHFANSRTNLHNFVKKISGFMKLAELVVLITKSSLACRLQKSKVTTFARCDRQLCSSDLHFSNVVQWIFNQLIISIDEPFTRETE